MEVDFKIYKILIVDDFYPDLIRMQDMLESFTDLELSVVDMCENGVQAMDSIKLHEPDIVICDIEMPYMTGLELCDQISEKYPDVRFLFCSMHSKFEYAQRAIHLAGAGYILKPVDKQNLYDVLRKLMEQIKADNQLNLEYDELKNIVQRNQPLLEQNFIKDLMCGFISHEDEFNDKMHYFDIPLLRYFHVILIEIGFPDFQGKPSLTGSSVSIDKAELRCIISMKMQEIVESAIGDNKNIIPVVIDDQHLSILFGSVNGSEKIEKEIRKFVKVIREQSKPYGTSLAFSVSDSGNDLFKMHFLFKQCKYIIKYKYLFDIGSTITPEDIPTDAAISYTDFNFIQSQIKYHLNIGTHDDIADFFDTLFKQNIPKNNELTIKSFCFFLVVCIQCALAESGDSFETVFTNDNNIYDRLMDSTNITAAKNCVVEAAITVHNHFRRKSSKKQIAIVESIERCVNYSDLKNISLESISSALHYNSHYLSYVYKQHREKSIFDYICHCKMEKAKSLLQNPKLKLYEITELVGYSHTSYFASVFKKYVGMTPNEYRMRNAATQ